MSPLTPECHGKNTKITLFNFENDQCDIYHVLFSFAILPIGYKKDPRYRLYRSQYRKRRNPILIPYIVAPRLPIPCCYTIYTHLSRPFDDRPSFSAHTREPSFFTRFSLALITKYRLSTDK